MKDRIERAGTQPVPVSAELVDHRLAVDRALGGVMENMEPDETGVKTSVEHRAPMSKSDNGNRRLAEIDGDSQWCYHDSMSWKARASIAIVLALACATLPLIVDQCTESCEAHSSVSSTSSPSCHHAASTKERVGRIPAPCGHDHSGSVTTLTVGPSASSRAWVLAATTAVGPTATVDLATHRAEIGSTASPPASRSLTLSVPLRI